LLNHFYPAGFYYQSIRFKQCFFDNIFAGFCGCLKYFFLPENQACACFQAATQDAQVAVIASRLKRDERGILDPDYNIGTLEKTT